jgi:hypothetical protein
MPVVRAASSTFRCVSSADFPSWHEQVGDPTLADGILDRMA